MVNEITRIFVTFATINLLYQNLYHFIPKIKLLHFMDPLELALQGVIAVEAGLIENASLLFTAGFQVTPTGQTKFSSNLLEDRAECHWGLGHPKEVCADVRKALELHSGLKSRERFF